ncbi:conserved hypothetical protein [Trichinella spiralis]|uniref:hypothetical protein n=1 Tax=Trichinella spiralis TaxID=6334 RepID=UPI0001EFE4B9|nr:conserved hypothetical protein [Trichinella spiralis]
MLENSYFLLNSEKKRCGAENWQPIPGRWKSITDGGTSVCIKIRRTSNLVPIYSKTTMQFKMKVSKIPSSIKWRSFCEAWNMFQRTNQWIPQNIRINAMHELNCLK